MIITIENHWNGTTILTGEYKSIKECLERNLGAWLRGANLRGAWLRGAKNYKVSHDFWLEIIRRQPLKTFTDEEWAIVGRVYAHYLCWGTIKSRYGATIIPLFKKLAKAGFAEWEDYYKEYAPEFYPEKQKRDRKGRFSK